MLKVLKGVLDAKPDGESFDAICDLIEEKWAMYIDPWIRIQIHCTLTSNPNFFRLNPKTNKWELLDASFLYANGKERFKCLIDILERVFDHPVDSSVSNQDDYYSLGDGSAVWIPELGHEKWANEVSSNTDIWIEKPYVSASRPSSQNTPRKTDKIRYIFSHPDGVSQGGMFEFKGVFKERENTSGDERVFYQTSDKVLKKGAALTLTHSRRIVICNIAYMKYYRGITGDDQILGGGGSYTTKNKDGGEKFNFLADENGIVRGFVETLYRGGNKHMGDINYAKEMRLENIDPACKGKDRVEGVRVVFISKGPGKKRNVVVGWYDNATVYRKRQKSSSGFGFSMECAAEDAHLIPDAHRTFEYRKKNKDGTFNFGQSNVSYPRLFTQEATVKLVRELNDYLDKRLAS